MRAAEFDYVPAFGKDFLLPFFDPVVKLLGADRVRGMLLEGAQLRAGHRVLDLGCGTGTLAVAIKQRYPEVHVVGVDPDPKALVRARRKTERAAVSIQFDRGWAQTLPYADDSFDRVISTLTLHHLSIGAKRSALCEAHRVLKPGGSLHVLDMAGDAPHERSRLPRWLHAALHPSDNSANLILQFIRDVGFKEPQNYASDRLLAGMMVEFYRATA